MIKSNLNIDTLNYFKEFNKFSVFTLLVVSIFFPFIGTILMLFSVVFSNPKFISLRNVSFICSLFLSLVNISKSRDVGDVVAISRDFKIAETLGYLDFVILIFEEPFYSSFIWLSSKLFFGNFNLFVFFSSFIFYYFINIHIAKIFQKYNFEKSKIILTIIFFSFFPFIFTWSFHLTRQVLSIMFLIISISYFLQEKKFYYLFFVLGILTHSSLGLYLPVMLFIVLNKKFNLKLAISISSIILIPTVYAFQKILNSNNYTQSISDRLNESGFDDGGSINLISLVIMGLVLIYSIFLAIQKKGKCLEILLFPIFTILIIFYSYQIMPLLGYRLTINVYIFMPMIFLISLKSLNTLFFRSIKLPFTISIFYWFMFYIFNGPWSYGRPEKIIFFNIYDNFYGIFN
jgi:hypothetical protein